MVEDLTNNVPLEVVTTHLKPHEMAEVEKRLGEHHANPQDVVNWIAVKTNLKIRQDATCY